MAGGSLNLASSRGSGEDIININPQITFFKKVYKRHTNFGIETREISSDIPSDFNTPITYNIDNYGSLISEMHYEFTLPNITEHPVERNLAINTVKFAADTGTFKLNFANPANNNETNFISNKIGRLIKIVEGNGIGNIIKVSGYIDSTVTYKSNINLTDQTNPTKVTLESDSSFRSRYIYYVNNVGHAILDNANLEIDGTTIDRHTGVWMDIWNELTDSNHKEWDMIGKRTGDPAGTYKEGLVLDTTNNFPDTAGKHRYYVPLKFYFNRNTGLAFPIFLMSDNSVKITLSLNSKNSLVKFDRSTTTTPHNVNPNLSELTLENFKFYTTYIFLDQGEENRIRKNLPNEYLIETLTINEDLNNTTLSRIDNISNPVKELVWVFRNNARVATYAGDTNSPTPQRLSVNDVLRQSRVSAEEFTNEPFNYAFHRINNDMDFGTRDPISTVKILISSQERVRRTDATYFRTIQPYNYHSNMPGGINNVEKKKYIYVYSFALNPEEYQPSGSFNFSKEDDTLSFELTSPSDTGSVGTSGMPTNYTMNLYARGYKFLSVSDKKIELRDVPYTQSSLTTGIESEIGGSKGITDPNLQKARKIERNIRYVQTTHEHTHNKKKKWGGLQDEYFKDN